MKLSNFLTQIAMVPDLKRANQLLDQYFSTHGIRSYAFTYYSLYPTSGRKLLYDMASSALQPWHQHFIESKYEDSDQTLQWSKQAILPSFWDVYQQLAQARTTREKLLRQESIEFGIHQGLLIPVHGPQDDFAVLVLHQKQNETCLDNYQEILPELITVAQYYYHAVKQLLFANTQQQQTYQLTKRELQCLQLCAQHKSTAEIAKKIGITERTVHFHVQNCNKKLAVKNKYQAVAKARELGLI